MQIPDIKKKLEFLKWVDPFTYVDLFIMPKLNPKKDKMVEWVVYIVSAFLFAFIIYTGLGMLFHTPSPMVIVVSGSMEPVMFRGDVVALNGKPVDEIKAQEVELNEPISGVPVKDYLETFCTGTLSERPMNCIDYFKLAPERGIFPSSFKAVKIKFSNGKAIDIGTDGDVIVYFSQRLNEPIIHRVVAKIKAKDGIFFLTKGDSINNPLLDQELGISAYAIPHSEIQGVAVLRIPLLGYVKLLIFDDLTNLIFGCKRAGGCPFP